MPLTRLANMVLAHDEHFHVVWTPAMTVAEAQLWSDDVMAFLDRTQGTRVVVAVLPPEAPAPTPEVRAAIGAAIDRMSAAGAYSGCIILGSGFKASMQRSVVAAIALLTKRNERAMRIARDGEEFLTRLPPELAAHAEGFRALLTAAEHAMAAGAPRPG